MKISNIKKRTWGIIAVLSVAAIASAATFSSTYFGAVTLATINLAVSNAANTFSTTITAEPTAARAITLPDRAGRVSLDTVTVNAVTTSAVAVTDASEVFVFTGAGIQTLPEASTAIGMSFEFVVGTVANMDINPADGTDQILLLTNAAGDAIRADLTGETIILTAIAADQWVATAISGTWSDVN